MPLVVVTQLGEACERPGFPLITSPFEEARFKDKTPLPARGEIAILPVVLPPRVKVLPFSVWMLPLPSSDNALLFIVPEIEAVGVPAPTELMNANLALVVLVPPNNKSSVRLF